MALTEKQKAFVQEYLVDLNATAAAERAGYSRKTARSIGAENLTKPDIQKAIQAAIKSREERTEVTQDRVVEELARIAFSDATDIVQVVNGTMVVSDTDQLTTAQKAAIAQIKEGKFGLEVTRCDKVKALELLGKHLGLFDGRPDSADGEVQIIDDL